MSSSRLLGLWLLVVAGAAAVTLAPGLASATTPPTPVNQAAPSISAGAGNLTEGDTLTADPGSWSGANELDYRWRRCDSRCYAIDGATARGYRATAADVGHRLLVTVHAVAGPNAQAWADSTQTAVVRPLPPDVVALPTIAGAARDGARLDAVPGTWSSSAAISSFAYRWQQCDAAGAQCADIPGATWKGLVLPSTHTGVTTLRVVVTATNWGGSAVAASAAVGPVRAALPESVIPPAVTGSPRQGKTLVASPGTWAGTAPLSYGYRWSRCAVDGTGCAEIDGGAGRDYTLTAADVGKVVRVAVTATNGVGAATASSARTAEIAAGVGANTSPPTISGTAREGAQLVAGTGTWSGAPSRFLYAWSRCDALGLSCAAISGADAGTFTPGPAEVGRTVSVTVTAVVSGDAVSSTSAPTSAVSPLAPVNVSAPSVRGPAAYLGTLALDPGQWRSSATVQYTYQWQSCGPGDCVPILGAVRTSLALGPEYVGRSVRVAVTATNVGGSAVAVSAATPVVTAPAPVAVAPPSISGVGRVGLTLTAAPGQWRGAPPLTYGFRWRRCSGADALSCIDVEGATGPAYLVRPADEGHALLVVVTATSAGRAASAQSAPSMVALRGAKPAAGAAGEGSAGRASAAARLAVTIQASAKSGYVGGTIVYHVVVANHGGRRSDRTTLRSAFAGSTRVESSYLDRGRCAAGAPLVCRVDSLAPGASATLRVVVLIIGRGPVTAQARAGRRTHVSRATLRLPVTQFPSRARTR